MGNYNVKLKTNTKFQQNQIHLVTSKSQNAVNKIECIRSDFYAVSGAQN